VQALKEKQEAERTGMWVSMAIKTGVSLVAGLAGGQTGQAVGNAVNAGYDAVDKQWGFKRTADDKDLLMKHFEVHEAMIDMELENAKESAEQTLNFMRDVRSKMEAIERSNTEGVRGTSRGSRACRSS
jgi:hypothetical protein